MFKKIDKDKKITLSEEGGSTIISYMPSFKSKHIKLLRSIITFDASIMQNVKGFDVYINDEIIDQISIDQSNMNGKICIDITDELTDLLRTKKSKLNIELKNIIKTFDNSSFECVSEYVMAKQYLEKNSYQECSAKRAGSGKINLASGELVFAHRDVQNNVSMLPMNISHVYNSFNAENENDSVSMQDDEFYLPKTFCGKGWKLNFQQYLVKERPNTSTFDNDIAANYTYVKDDGSQILFQQKYFYKKSGERFYVSPSQIEIDLDKSLHYLDGDVRYDVESEMVTDSGLILTAKLEGFKGLDLISQDIEEIAKIKEQIKQIDKEIKLYQENLDLKQKEEELRSTALDVYEAQKKIEELNKNLNKVVNECSKQGFIYERDYMKNQIEYLKLYSPKLPENADNNEKNANDFFKTANNRQAAVMNNNNKYNWGDNWENNSTYSSSSINGQKENILQKTLELEPLSEKYHNEQVELQNTQSTLEKQHIEEYISIYEQELKKLKFELSEYEKQIPEYYIASADKSVIFGFAKFREESLAKPEGSSNEESGNEIYRLIAIGDQYENALYINYTDGDSYLSSKIGSITDNNNNLVAFEYGDDGNLSKIIDDKNREVSYEYEDNRLKKITYSDETCSEYKYNEQGMLCKVVDNSGYFVEFKFFEEPNQISIYEGSKYEEISHGKEPLLHKDSDGLTTETTQKVLDIFLSNHKMTKVQDRLGNEQTYLFDTLGRPTTIYQGKFDEENLNHTKIVSVSHEYSDNKCTRNVQKLHDSKNLLNAYFENYVGDDAFFGDEVYTTLHENKSRKYFYQVNGETENSFKEIIIEDSILQLLNAGTNSYVFSAWAKADSAYINKYEDLNSNNEVENLILNNIDSKKLSRKFELRAEISYSDQSTEVQRVCFDWMQTNWQYAELPIILNKQKSVSGLKLCFDYSQNTGLAKVFGMSLQEAVVEETEYGSDNLPKSTHNTLTNITTTYFYTNGRLTKEIISFNGKNYENKYAYNKQGSLTRSQDYNGMVKEQEYNKKGQLIKTSTYNISDPANKFVSTTLLNEDGKQTCSVNEFGEISETYDISAETGAVLSKTDAQGNKTCFGHNPNSGELNIISTMVNDEENHNIYGYTLGQLTRLSHNDFDINYAYNGLGEQTQVSIANKVYASATKVSDTASKTTFASGEVIETIINSKGNHVQTSYMVGEDKTANLTSKYDSDDHLTEQIENIYNETNVYNYNYDKFGNQTYFSKSKQASGSSSPVPEIEISTAYNKHGNITSTQTVIEDAIMKTEYEYDNSIDNVLTSVKLSNDQVQKINYDAFGRAKDIFTNDALSKHLSFVSRGGYASNMVSTEWFGKNGIIKDSLKYSYDAKGNITKIAENGQVFVSYAYDALSRLVREDNKKLGKTFIIDYDKGGNIIRKTEYVFTQKPTEMLENGTVFEYGYNVTGWKDQLVEFNGKSFVYDSLGNPTTFKDNTLSWGHLRNLEHFGSNISYKYNAGGIRTSKVVNGKITKIYTNANKIVAQDDGNKLYFHYGIDGLAGFTYKVSDDVIKYYYYKKNIQGDIIGIYNEDYKEIVKYVYDAWGNFRTLILTNNVEDIYESEKPEYSDDNEFENNKFIAELNPFRYRSYYYDVETGLYYLNSRYYDPEMGRFINSDDINYVETRINGLNLYCYCGNNPIGNIDYTGFKSLKNAWNNVKNWFKNGWNDFKNFVNETWDIFTGAVISGLLVAGGTALTVTSLGFLGGVGSAMIGAGVGGFIDGLQSKLNGGSYWAGYLGGAISGGITGFGISFGPVGAFFGGSIGKFAGTLVTDLLNGVSVNDGYYWLDRIGDSVLAGLISYSGQRFAEQIKFLNTPGFKDIFISITVLSEFIFSSLYETTRNFIKGFFESLRCLSNLNY